MSGSGDKIVEVWKGIKDVESTAPEQGQIVLRDVVRQRIDLSFLGIEILFVIKGDKFREARELRDKACG